MKLLPLTACPFCGHKISQEDRELIMSRISEQKEDGSYVLKGFRVICSECNAEVTLLRQTEYESLEGD